MIYEETNDWRKEFGRAIDILNWDVFKMDFKPTDITYMLSDKRNERISVPKSLDMTRDDIIRLAQEACKPDAPFRQYVGDVDCGLLMKDEHLERFATLVAAAEREACASIADSYEPTCESCPRGVANAIRARGET